MLVNKSEYLMLKWRKTPENLGEIDINNVKTFTTIGHTDYKKTD